LAAGVEVVLGIYLATYVHCVILFPSLSVDVPTIIIIKHEWFAGNFNQIWINFADAVKNFCNLEFWRVLGI